MLNLFQTNSTNCVQFIIKNTSNLNSFTNVNYHLQTKQKKKTIIFSFIIGRKELVAKKKNCTTEEKYCPTLLPCHYYDK